jgi:hypothetical protein
MWVVMSVFYKYVTSSRSDISLYLNHDFNKIYKIAKIIADNQKNPANLDNRRSTREQSHACMGFAEQQGGRPKVNLIKIPVQTKFNVQCSKFNVQSLKFNVQSAFTTSKRLNIYSIYQYPKCATPKGSNVGGNVGFL